MAPATTSSRAASPASWPLVRGRPRWLAQRPLPSMTIATWLGTRARGQVRGQGAARVRERPRVGDRSCLGLHPQLRGRRWSRWDHGARPGAANAPHARGATAGTPSPARCPPGGAGRPRHRPPPSRRRAAPRGARGSPAPAPRSRAGGIPGTPSPPAARLNARCGPSAPQRAQSWKLGAQPAIARARSRYASRTRPGSWAPSAMERSAPPSRRYCCTDGSRSSVSRSAVSSIAVAAV